MAGSPQQVDLIDPYTWLESERIQPIQGDPLTLRYHLVQDLEALHRMEEFLSEEKDITHDTETSGLNVFLGARVIGHAFAAQTDSHEISAWYIPIRHINTSEYQLPVDTVSEAAQAVLAGSPTKGPGRCGYCHAKFDWLMSSVDGITCKRDCHDVALLATVNNENEYSFALKRLAAKYCLDGARDEEKELEAWMKKDARSLKMKYKKRARGEIEEIDMLGEPTYLEKFGYSRTPVKLCGKYACKDVIYTLYLWLKTFAQVPAKYPQVYKREKSMSVILHEMESTGLPLDEKLVREVHDKSGAQVLYWLKECRRMAESDEFLATDDEIRALLYDKFKLIPQKWTKGGKAKVKKPSADKEARGLLKGAYPDYAPLIDALNNLSDVRKVHSTYSGSFLKFYDPNTKRIYPHYNQLERREKGGVPVTGRLSSQDPNMQNVKKKPLVMPDGSEINIREYFMVPEGWVRFYIDFEQIELKILAWFSQDSNLLKAYREGIDVHQLTADLLGISRDIAKQVNFGNSYGMTEMGLAQRMPGYYEDPKGTREKAKQVLKAFFVQYSAIKKFEATLASDMRRNNCMFVNPFGRPRRIPNIKSYQKWERERAHRQMMSSIISGTAADLLKECMIKVHGIFKTDMPDGKFVQTIHDEVVADLPINQPWAEVLIKVIRVMEDWPMFSESGPKGRGEGVPIKVSCDLTTTTWAEKRGIILDKNDCFRWAA